MSSREQNRQNFGIYFPVVGMAVIAGLYFSAIQWLAAKDGRFTLSAEQLLWLISTTTFSSTILSFVLGRLSDRIGRKPLRIIGCAVIVVTSLLTMYAFAIWHLFALMICGSLGMSMFWPTTQADLNDKVPENKKLSALARYNCVWSAAVLGAAPLMGLLCAKNIMAPYLVTALLAAAVFYAIRKFPVAVSAEKKISAQLPVDNDHEVRTMFFLRIAYLSNCIIWGARTALGTLIPAINANMNRSSTENGICLMLFVLFLFVGFCRLSFNPNWRYKLRLLFVAQVVTLVCTVLAAVCMNDFILMTFFLAVTGLGASVTYSSSQFYALDTRRNAGMRVGLHESLLNLGSIVVPLIASYVAAVTKRVDLAFYTIAIIIGVSLAAQSILAALTLRDRHHGLEKNAPIPIELPAEEVLVS